MKYFFEKVLVDSNTSLSKAGIDKLSGTKNGSKSSSNSLRNSFNSVLSKKDFWEKSRSEECVNLEFWMFH